MGKWKTECSIVLESVDWNSVPALGVVAVIKTIDEKQIVLV